MTRMAATHAEIAARVVERGGVVMITGSTDTGKTSLSRQILQLAIEAGEEVAYVDADVGQTTVGPPTCVGLRWVSDSGDLQDLTVANELRFVGGISPNRLVLQHVVATAALVDQARQASRLTVIDTTGVVSGVTGQTLKYHKMELCRPDTVVALQRGAEMEPLVGMLRRFFGAEVEVAGIHSDVISVSPDERSAHRAKRFSEAMGPPLERWRVRPTVFAPTLPAGLDLERLEGMLVGIHDEQGRCLGLGMLEYSDEALRVVTNVSEEMVGLRLGSLRIDPETFATEPVSLREVMFGL